MVSITFYRSCTPNKQSVRIRPSLVHEQKCFSAKETTWSILTGYCRSKGIGIFWKKKKNRVLKIGVKLKVTELANRNVFKDNSFGGKGFINTNGYPNSFEFPSFDESHSTNFYLGEIFPMLHNTKYLTTRLTWSLTAVIYRFIIKDISKIIR